MTKPKRYKRFSFEFTREAIIQAGEEGMSDKAVELRLLNNHFVSLAPYGLVWQRA